MFSPCLGRILAGLLSGGFLLLGSGVGLGAEDPGRAVLPANDGWASVPTATLPQGTTGGSAATPARTHTVTNRKELLAALAWPEGTPKLVYVKCAIDLNVDDNNAPLTCPDSHPPDPATAQPYSLHGFLAMYDHAGPLGLRNKKAGLDPWGGQEQARAASAAAQASRIRVRVPPNTTIYGQGIDATLIGAWLEIAGASERGAAAMNVIVRNLSFLDTQ